MELPLQIDVKERLEALLACYSSSGLGNTAVNVHSSIDQPTLFALLKQDILVPRKETIVMSLFSDIIPIVFVEEMEACIALRSSEAIITFLSTLATLGPCSSDALAFAEYILGNDIMNHVESEILSSFLPQKYSLDLVVSLYRLLNADRNRFTTYISRQVLHSLIQHYSGTDGDGNYGSSAIVYISLHILSAVLDSSDIAADKWFEKYVSVESVLDTYYGQNSIDYKYFALLEAKRISHLSNTVRKYAPLVRSVAEGLPINPSHHLILNVGGLLIPNLFQTSSPSSLHQSLFVQTPLSLKSISSIARVLKSTGPILIKGPEGSGKTFYTEQIAEKFGQLENLVRIHLGDQTDAKILIGTYSAGEQPGSFEWRAGILTVAVQQGRWVLIEDIDKAPNDILSVLLSLLDHRELTIPSRGETIRANRNFRVFATMRTNELNNTTSSGITELIGQRLWNIVETHKLSAEDLKHIISKRFPLLESLCEQFVSTFFAIKDMYSEKQFTSMVRGSPIRQCSTRDLIKWTKRVNNLLIQKGVSSHNEEFSSEIYSFIFSEAVDCFAASLPNYSSYEHIVTLIGNRLDVSSSRISLYLTKNVPQLQNFSDSVSIGRAQLSKLVVNSSNRKTESRSTFALTNHSLRLLEQISVGVSMAEPLLLVGETGTGKTTVIQYLAKMLGKRLISINLSQQTEIGDLLGGYKPVEGAMLAAPMTEQFDYLFDITFSAKKNAKFLSLLARCYQRKHWTNVIKLWKEAVKMARDLLGSSVEEQELNPPSSPMKKRKLNADTQRSLFSQWLVFSDQIATFESKVKHAESSFLFQFVEGLLVQAVRQGDWVLLDEVNLASPDTLECISDLLVEKPTISLVEKGDTGSINAHPDFRLFGCMNPATDVGKRDLPAGLRSRFTELYVTSPDRDIADLLAIVDKYIGKLAMTDQWVGNDVAQLYLTAKKLADDNKIVDGANQKPHFSIRTLSRTLQYCSAIYHIYGLRRSLYEGFCMSFLTLLDRPSEKILNPIIIQYTIGKLKNMKSVISQIPPPPQPAEDFVQFRHYWLQKGPQEPEEQQNYIITPSVEKNLLNLTRATSGKLFPILIQGPTSSGKTSMINHLAKISGHKFVRINNHEHTDLQEYLGSYVSDDKGLLKFQEGALVNAIRNGHWIVLDELNLAPTDVLEALNRLLDDNRELLIPDTQEIVKPHPEFMLFATQNPPGLYGGRKVLSRAFRNRFLELHFDDIPEDELEDILRERCQIAPSYAKKIVDTYRQLAIVRQSNRLFEQKNSFATLRDLFRWAQREAVGYEALALNGYILLGERVRNPEEKAVVKKIIEKVMKVTLNIDEEYQKLLPAAILESNQVVWTKGMKRLLALLSQALRYNEPVLLVGETGCGKTTICQLLAEYLGKNLYMVNAHQNTETGDIIGAQRPVRNRSELQLTISKNIRSLAVSIGIGEMDGISFDDLLSEYQHIDKSAYPDYAEQFSEIDRQVDQLNVLFEWADGSLIQALKQGDFFLLDEISLADDSVLERLNSVLEPERSLLLTEKGYKDAFISAQEGFQFLATMNPGGDYGKKELSPALRNRFTEIWVPSMEDFSDVLMIVETRLDEGLLQQKTGVSYSQAIVRFAKWFGERYGSGNASSGVISLRDIISWILFVNSMSKVMDPTLAVFHGACMVFVDSIGSNSSASLSQTKSVLMTHRRECVEKLSKLLGTDFSSTYFGPCKVTLSEKAVSFGDFVLPREATSSTISFTFDAPTTATNGLRVIRALHMRRPILLEGSPGVGKTSLVTALANVFGRPLTRINLSEQTDLIDLFGADAPVEGEKAGEFVWKDAPFLRAMQKGEWVLLDEMNLASQSVLEGLNACLDHRGTAYIPELDKTFERHPDFLVFAAQNPQFQGGGRKGLPKSFVNRFSVVYVDILTMDDLQIISRRLHPSISEHEIEKLTRFVADLDDQVSIQKAFGQLGSPFEFNLRDTMRWLDLYEKYSMKEGLLHGVASLSDFFETVICSRFRSASDREKALTLFESYFGKTHAYEDHMFLSNDFIQVNGLVVSRHGEWGYHYPKSLPLQCNTVALTTMLTCVENSWPVIVVGPTNSGKTELIRYAANVYGGEVVVKEFSMNSDVDSTDLLGGFDQVDDTHSTSSIWDDALAIYTDIAKAAYSTGRTDIIAHPSIKGFEDVLLNVSSDSNVSTSLRLQQLCSFLSDSPLIDAGIASRVSALFETASAVLSNLKRAQSARFQWFDGTLIKAIEKGHWLVLDNANLCNPSVLDRLNSLLEPNGCLVVNECSMENGEPRMVRPHPNFRLFLTVNPKYGELSRAMRNRGVEIYLDSLNNRASSYDRSLLFTEDGLSVPSYVSVNSSDSGVRTLALVDDVVTRSSHVSVDVLGSQLISVMPLSQIPRLEKWLDVAVRSQLYSRFYLSVLQAVCADLTNLYQSPYKKLAESSYADISNTTCLSRGCSDFVSSLSFDPLSNPYWGRFLTFATMEEYHRLLFFTLDVSKAVHLLESTARGVAGPGDTYFAQSALVYLGKLVKNKPKFQVYGLSKALLDIIVQWLSSNLADLNRLGDFMELFSICDNLISLTNGNSRSSMDESEIPVYKRYLENWVKTHSSLSNIDSSVTSSVQTVLESFSLDADWHKAVLMDLIWKRLKGTYPTSAAGWDIVKTLLNLSGRLDSVCYQLIEDSEAEVKSLRKFIIEAIQRAYCLNSHSAEAELQLITHQLETGVTNLESQAANFKKQRFRVFTDVFKSLFVVLELRDSRGTDIDELAVMSLFSDIPLSYVAKYSTPNSRLKPFAPVLELLPYFEEPGELDDNMLNRKILAALGRYRNIESSTFTQASKDLKLFGSTVISHWRIAADSVSLGLSELLKSSYSYSSDLLAHGTIAMFEEQTLDLGSLWISFSLDLLSKFIPDFVYDPAIEEHVSYHRKKNHLSKYKELFRTWKTVASVFSGDGENGVSSHLASVLASLDDPMPPHTFRPRDGQINILFREVHSFIESQANEKRIEEVIASGPEHIRQWRINTSRFIWLIKTKFTYFADIISILEGILLGLRLGVSLKLKSLVGSQQKGFDMLWTIDPQIVIIPDQNVLDVIGNSLDAISPSSQLRVLEILTINMKKDVNNRQFLQRAVSSILKSVYYRWTLVQMKSQEADAAKTSIYKDNSEQEAEEDFKRMFPDFEEVLEVGANSETSESEPFDDYALMEIYLSMFSETAPVRTLSDVLEKNCENLISYSTDVISSNLIGEGALATVIQSIAISLKARYDASTSSSSLFNFYHDSNPFETNRMVQLVEKIQAFVLSLLDRWPSHYTLVNISTACSELLVFPISTPIARMLQKVEQILTFLVEWETYASQEVSLKESVSEVTDLIISWRKLELSTWPKLFDFEDLNVKKSMAKWWYYLFENLIFNPSQTENEEETDLIELVKLLSIFISQSAYGQFNMRLDLLRAFAGHSKILGNDAVFGAINNVVRFYEQYVPQIKDVIKGQRKSLERDVKEIIQLASWKDTNISALKESSRRSHSKLYKVVRKYRDLINKPVSDITDSNAPGLNLHDSGTDPASPLLWDYPPLAEHIAMATKLESWVQRPLVLTRVVSTAETMRKFALEISEKPIASLNDLAATAVELSEKLKKETPSTLTDETKKIISQLRMEKAESLHYIIKQLRAAGLSTSAKSSVLVKQDQTSKLLSKVNPCDLGKGDSYFYRILEMLPRLRSNVIGGGSGDVAHADLQRGLNIGENLMASLLSKRNLLAQLEAHMVHIQHLVECSRTLCTLLNRNSSIFIQNAFTTPYEVLQQLLAWLPDVIDHCLQLTVSSSYFGSNNDEITNYHLLKNNLADWNRRFDQFRDFYRFQVSSPDFGDFFNDVKSTLDSFIRANSGTLASTVFKRCVDTIIGDRENFQLGSVSELALSEEVAAFGAETADLSKSMLVVQQIVYKLSQEEISDEEDNWYTSTQHKLSSQLKSLHSSEIASKLEKLLESFRGVAVSNEAVALLGSLVPFAVEYLNLTKIIFSIAQADFSTTSKSAYMLFVCLYNLAKEGFCGPQESSEEEQDSSAMKDGTGLGDGSGAKNNSNDVEEDEDLTEQAQTENKEKSDNEDDDDENDDAVSIEGDMAGDLEDYDAKEDEEDEDNEEEDNEDDSELDEEIGDIDELDPNQLDEKMWDEQGENNKEKQTDQDVGSANDDMQGADDNDETSEPNDKEPDSKDKEPTEEDGEKDDENEEDDEEEGEEDVGMQEDDVNQKDQEDVDPYVPESDILDINDDLNLDEDGDNKEEEDNNAEEELDGDEETEDAGEVPEDIEEDQKPSDVLQQDETKEDNEMEEEASKEEDMTEEGSGDKEEEAGTEDEKEDDHAMDEKAAEEDEPVGVKNENNIPAPEDEMNVDTEGLDGPTNEEDETANESQPEQSAVSKSESSNSGKGADDQTSLETENAGLGESDIKPEPKAPDEEEAATVSQDEARESAKEIMKQLGSSLEEFYRRRDDIKEASEREHDDTNQNEESSNIRPDEFEHIEGEESHADTQALGAASSLEQNQKIDDSMQIDEEDEPVLETEKPVDSTELDGEEQTNQNDNMNADEISGANAQSASIIGGKSSENKPSVISINHEDEEDNIDEMDIENANEEIVDELPVRSLDEAREMWKKYDSSTQELAMTLCEQLRLILEPTRATKLRGDFKTGKRLNMKRIIPYIASQFKKDKIWLRRTKPSKRDYQVMISLDDSKSMSESKAVDLAFQTIAMVSKAFNQLEVGQIAITRFGEKTRLIHPFEKPFSSEAGVEVLRWFGFDENKTDVSKLLKKSISLFETARQDSRSDNWQLEIIISDGICEDHDELRRLVRKALEEKIIMVFVVVDSVNTGGSILDMNQVKYETDASGNMELQMERYLEHFPFDYYIIVRDIRELPMVLSSVLRQYFSESMG